jgi:hypothetical protein
MRYARAESLEDRNQLPLVLEAPSDSMDLAAWSRENRAWIEERLPVVGGILFRRFAVPGQQAFQEFVATVSSQLLDYVEGGTPRTSLGDKIYTSTEFPASRWIMPHNELSHVRTGWPTRIWFCCLLPAHSGGETPICDVRRVFERIPQDIRDKFLAKGWMLQRNFGNGVISPWQKFGVSSKSELEKYCESADIQCEWLGAHHLRTTQVRPAVMRHPKTGEWLWFNHAAFWNLGSLSEAVRESMLTIYSMDQVPYHTYYGDGSQIEADEIRAINAAYQAELLSFTWQQGDVLMLDNMLVAHGRAPFQGSRKVIVSMGDPYAN